MTTTPPSPWLAVLQTTLCFGVGGVTVGGVDLITRLLRGSAATGGGTQADEGWGNREEDDEQALSSCGFYLAPAGAVAALQQGGCVWVTETGQDPPTPLPTTTTTQGPIPGHLHDGRLSITSIKSPPGPSSP